MGKWENRGYLRNYCNQWPENLKVQTTNSVSIEGHRQGHFLTLFFPDFVYFVLIRGQDIR